MIAALRRRLRLVTSEQTRDRGISLVELIVAMMIFSILLAMTVGLFTSASRAQSVAGSIDSTTRQASNGLDEMTRIIRGAITNPVVNQQLPDPAFVAAYTGDNVIRLYSQVNLTSSIAQPVMVQFSVNSSNYLVEQTWQPITSGGYYTFGSNPTTTRTIAGPLVLPSSGGPNLFSYLDTNNATIATSGGLIPSASTQNVAAVTVSLQVGTANTPSQSTLLTNTVGLPNLPVTRTLIP